MTTIRTFLAITIMKKWDIRQIDIHNAFLHGDLEENENSSWFSGKKY